MINKTVIELGLFDDEAEQLKKELNKIGGSLTLADCVIDLIAIPAFLIIISTEYFGNEELGSFYDFYGEPEEIAETVVFVGGIEVPDEFADKALVLKSFDDLMLNLRYLVRSAWDKYNREIQQIDCAEDQFEDDILQNAKEDL